MIRIFCKLTARPECAEKFAEVAASLVAASRAEEGNVFYTLNRSLDDPCTFAFMECWKDQAAVDEHNATKHFTETLPQLAQMCSAVGDVELYEAVE